MPNCFQLTPKGSTEPATLVAIDEAMCAHFHQPVHPTKYLCGWFDSIGFKLAIGQTLPQIVQHYADMTAEFPNDTWPGDLCRIAQWLDDNYTSDAWAEIGRR